MKFAKNKEDGFLLLESLITLGMIASIILLIYPLVVNWMSIRQDAKNKVELNRVFYEQSMNWNPTQSLDENNNSYNIQSKEHFLKVEKDNQEIEVIVYEYKFE